MFSVLNLQSLLGLLVIVAACWSLSENRRAFPWRLALRAVTVQAALVKWGSSAGHSFSRG